MMFLSWLASQKKFSYNLVVRYANNYWFKILLNNLCAQQLKYSSLLCARQVHHQHVLSWAGKGILSLS